MHFNSNLTPDLDIFNPDWYDTLCAEYEGDFNAKDTEDSRTLDDILGGLAELHRICQQYRIPFHSVLADMRHIYVEDHGVTPDTWRRAVDTFNAQRAC